MQIQVESQFRLKSYEHLLDGVSGCAEHVANYIAIFSEGCSQMFFLPSFYINSNSITYCHLFVE